MNGETVDFERADVEIDAIFSEFKQRPAVERAFIVIQSFWNAAEELLETGGGITEKTAAAFRDWFFDPHDRAAKDAAMDRMIITAENDLRVLGISDCR